jgi:hypothetical protein
MRNVTAARLVAGEPRKMCTASVHKIEVVQLTMTPTATSALAVTPAQKTNQPALSIHR